MDARILGVICKTKTPPKRGLQVAFAITAQCQNKASRMMMGIGIPSSHNKIPLPMRSSWKIRDGNVGNEKLVPTRHVTKASPLAERLHDLVVQRLHQVRDHRAVAGLDERLQ